MGLPYVDEVLKCSREKVRFIPAATKMLVPRTCTRPLQCFSFDRKKKFYCVKRVVTPNGRFVPLLLRHTRKYGGHLKLI